MLLCKSEVTFHILSQLRKYALTFNSLRKSHNEQKVERERQREEREAVERE